MTATTTPTVEYLAVPDPGDAAHMTYWRRGPGGNLTPWPPKARYAPALYRRDVPGHLAGQQRVEWIRAWVDQHLTPWWRAIHAAIDADPTAAAATFAALTTRCCWCGRRLTDPTSKVYGIGPECRTDLPDEALTALAGAVGRAHAAQGGEAAAAVPADPRDGRAPRVTVNEVTSGTVVA